MKINECSCGCGGSSDKCTESGSDINYMFFGNLETMKRMIDDLMQMDPAEVDMILKNGNHNWAIDHIASSADDIQEVYNFLKNGESKDSFKQDAFAEDDGMLKAFESFVNEVSSKKWKSIESNLRGRKMNPFADRVAAHRKQYGTGDITEIDFVGRPVSGYDRKEINLHVTEIEIRQKSGSTFKLVGNDSKWGTVVIYGTVRSDGSIQMFESERIPLLVADRRNARDLIRLLIDERIISEAMVDWRLFTNGYTSFDDAY